MYEFAATSTCAATIPNPCKSRQGETLDGVHLLPYVMGEASGSPHEALVWRSGRYKAVLEKAEAEFSEPSWLTPFYVRITTDIWPSAPPDDAPYMLFPG